MTWKELRRAIEALDLPDDASVVFADLEDIKRVSSDSVCGEALIILSDTEESS